MRTTNPKCPGSGEYAASISDDGLAYLEGSTGPAAPALGALSSELVIRFPKGVCPTCHGTGSTNIKGQIRNHTDRTGTAA